MHLQAIQTTLSRPAQHVGKSSSVKMAAMEEECIVIAGATLGFMAIAGAAYEVSKK